MGKRVTVTPTEPQHVISSSRNIRKRKSAAALNLNGAKALRLNANHNNNTSSNHYWHDNDNDDEDSSSNDTADRHAHKYLNNSSSSMLLNATATSTATPTNSTTINNNAGHGSPIESPKPTYTLRPSLVNGTILHDLTNKPWRLGNPIGKGNFGEIFLASDNVGVPVSNANAKFVVKIEPHSNGPLFVEIHCLMNTARKQAASNAFDNGKPNHSVPTGIPDYIASGSHYFCGARYRFLVLPRFDRDLYSLIKNSRVHQKAVLTLAMQIVTVLERLHDKGYCHNDVKAQNLMISKCKYYQEGSSKGGSGIDGRQHQQSHKQQKVDQKSVANGNGVLKSSKYKDHYDEKQQTTDSGNSSEQETNEDDEDFVVKRRLPKRANVDSDDDDDDYDGDNNDDDDEDFDDGATSNSNSSRSTRLLQQTPLNRNRNSRTRSNHSGRTVRRNAERGSNVLEDMSISNSHNLRPSKRISYSVFFHEDGNSANSDDAMNSQTHSSDEDYEQFVPKSVRRATVKKSNAKSKRPPATSKNQLRCDNNHQQHHPNANNSMHQALVTVEEERIFLIDFGLASKFMDNGVHRPFVMDQRRAHDGTLEFTSRDAHMGAHSRRSDLECLGFNLLYWSQGYLPWKEAAAQHQQEKVHRAKEYLMTDVREMLKQIYGKQVPKYLGEFLHYINQLAYHERPDYALYRRIFQREFQQLGYSPPELRLDSNEIARTCIRVKDEIENKYDIFELNKHNVSANLSIGTPFHERTLSNRVSPKNLRSKSDKKALKKKKFSWAEILSQDPDQIARERAEKEFDREVHLNDVQKPTMRRYEGNPTYAILRIQRRLRLSGRLVEPPGALDHQHGGEEDDDDDDDGEEEDDEEEEEGEEEEEEEGDEEEDEEEVEVAEEADNDEDEEEENNDVDDDEDEEDEEEDDEEEQYIRGKMQEVDDEAEELNGHARGDDQSDDESDDDDGEEDEEEEEEEEESDESEELCSTSSRSYSRRGRATKSRKDKQARAPAPAPPTTTTVTQNTKRASAKGKRTTATVGKRNARKGVVQQQPSIASAAGEVENSARYMINYNHNNNDGNGPHPKTPIPAKGRAGERRTRVRRCLHKTDMNVDESRGTALHHHHHSAHNQQNDMRGLYANNTTATPTSWRQATGSEHHLFLKAHREHLTSSTLNAGSTKHYRK